MASSDQPTDARARLLAHFVGDTAEHNDRWSQLWDQKSFLPWDRYVPISPEALRYLSHDLPARPVSKASSPWLPTT